jgi:hypothetical protein
MIQIIHYPPTLTINNHLKSSLYDFYSQTLAKDFDVIRLLTSWHEFNNLETAKIKTVVFVVLLSGD